ncbi:MAG: ribosome small subunit-dependent GTPase A [Candidatus Thermoplasmatota archaeon]|nr:ribosome small subunit-dependent GTPase A [Candidatus Thermoplasmatota archaeon]
MDLKEYGLDEGILSAFEDLDLEGVGIGRIVNSDGFRMMTSEGEVQGRPSKKLRSLPEGMPVVGDWVVFKELEGANVIVMVMPRRSSLSRRSPGKRTVEQIVASNIDQVFVVMGLDHDYNIRRLERYLVMVSASGAECSIILNKADLVEDPAPYLTEVRIAAGNVPVHTISALIGQGVGSISLPKGRTICLVGSSGSGKSTLINRLIGSDRQATTPVGDHKSKGRHTTTSRELFLLPSGAMIIDNPGIREIQLWADPSSLEDAFPDIARLAACCRFKDCKHDREPDCAVLEAVSSGELPRDRYESYLKLQKEIRHNMVRSDRALAAAERDRWKALMKDVKNYQAYKKRGR